jgi:tetratricopeptide (TPR) repeat protein
LWELSRLVEGQDGLESAEAVNAFLQHAIEPRKQIHTEKVTALDRAQELMYRAWSSHGKRRVQLARQALQLSPDCADAYVLLAEETAASAAEARSLYARGVVAGERALGADVFKDGAGQFWAMIETRPYMRAREGLAECLWALGQRDDAIAHYQAMLKLNPGDNQGVRYMLASCLLESGYYEQADLLIRSYRADESAAWLYSKALLAFRRDGKGRRATLARTKALEANINVPAYLLGLERLPPSSPASYQRGDEAEAWAYLTYALRAWTDSPEALDWLADGFESALKQAVRDLQVHLPGLEALEEEPGQDRAGPSVHLASVLLRPGVRARS